MAKQKSPDPRLVGLLMAATGLSHEAVRRHLRDGTAPHNPLVAEAWEKTLKEAKQ